MKFRFLLFILLGFFTMSYGNTTMAHFMDQNNNRVVYNKTNNISMKMEKINIKLGKSCKNNKFQCCFSSGKKTSSIASITFIGKEKNNFKGKIYDYKFLTIFQEELYIYSRKINKKNQKKYKKIRDKKGYILLTGIIKSNT